MLMQAGFSSRLEAINAVRTTGATFSNSREFKKWLSSNRLRTYLTANLISANTEKLWKSFINEYKPKSDIVWSGSAIQLCVFWHCPIPLAGTFVKLQDTSSVVTEVISSDGELIGELSKRYRLLENGIYRAQTRENGLLYVTYWGAGDNPFEFY
jgi:hypothetical protein